MPQVPQKTTDINIRPTPYHHFDMVERLCDGTAESECVNYSIDPDKPLRPVRLFNRILRRLSLMLNPRRYSFCAYATDSTQIQGVIRVSPFNRTRTTWRVDQVAVGEKSLESVEPQDTVGTSAPTDVLKPRQQSALAPTLSDVGSQLLRHCFQSIWEARTWLLEVNVNDKTLMALYRQNGFQPLAQMTYWSIAAELLQDLADREPDLPNLLPVSNADAPLLYQLDTAASPPLVRQVFDRHILDFKSSLFSSLLDGIQHWLNRTEVVSGYVFEPQRKAAIGYFQIQLCRDGFQPHWAQLTVNPAYTWLYPELMAQMARIAQEFPRQSLQLVSSDYQPEREGYLEQMGAVRIAHTLMMSRSVWHKVREARSHALDALQIPEVLQGLQPARKPVPGRISILSMVDRAQVVDSTDADIGGRTEDAPLNGGTQTSRRLNFPSKSDFSDPPQEGPCC